MRGTGGESLSRSSALGSLRGEGGQRGWREGEEERTERTLVVTKKACLQMVQMMFIWAALLCARGEWGEGSARAVRAHGGKGRGERTQPSARWGPSWRPLRCARASAVPLRRCPAEVGTRCQLWVERKGGGRGVESARQRDWGFRRWTV